jgi:very-short-patch-repair endonuclease
MRRLLTLSELARVGVSRTAREEGWRRVAQGVYGEGVTVPTAFDRALGHVVATGGAASGRVAAALYGLDAVVVQRPEVTMPPSSSHRRPGVRRRRLRQGDVTLVGGYCCTNALLTLCDLAAAVDDLVWEQALESALRKGLVAIDELAHVADGTRGAARVQRVLALRPPGAPATESLLETLMVQLARRIEGLAPPTRQFEVRDSHDRFVARVDLSWPELGVFIELDGQQHADQPVYDATRETAVVVAKGWLCGRFTWYEVVHIPTTTARKLAGAVAQARRRPVCPT